jgi:N-methylhydantoinase A/oxoprolinase/acetone carboxylase beta subunit
LATRLRGPAIVEERESTTVVPPGMRLEVDADLNLVLTRDGRARS